MISALRVPLHWQAFEPRRLGPLCAEKEGLLLQGIIACVVGLLVGATAAAGSSSDPLRDSGRPDRMAALGLTVYDLIDALQKENINTSAGTLEVGRQKYRIRTKAEFNSVEDIENVVLRSDGRKRVLLKKE